VKIEKKNLDLVEFLRDLDIDNLEKDMLFSDLEDEEEPEPKTSTNDKRKDSAKSLIESEGSVPKSTKLQRKKSVMSYAI
jgi:hypothetical protein